MYKKQSIIILNYLGFTYNVKYSKLCETVGQTQAFGDRYLKHKFNVQYLAESPLEGIMITHKPTTLIKVVSHIGQQPKVDDRIKKIINI